MCSVGGRRHAPPWARPAAARRPPLSERPPPTPVPAPPTCPRGARGAAASAAPRGPPAEGRGYLSGDFPVSAGRGNRTRAPPNNLARRRSQAAAHGRPISYKEIFTLALRGTGWGQGRRTGRGGRGGRMEGGRSEGENPPHFRQRAGREARGWVGARGFFFPGSRLGWGRRLRGSTCPLALKAHFTWIHSRKGGGRSPSNSRERRAALQVSRVAEGRGKGKVSRVCHHEGRAGTSERERSGVAALERTGHRGF